MQTQQPLYDEAAEGTGPHLQPKRERGHLHPCKSRSICSRKNLLGSQGGRNTGLHTALDASLHSCKHSYFSTSTSDFPRYTFKEVDCTNPILFLPKFSSPTFQLASQHCSKWRIEQRWCKWTWWIASSKETENINIFIISGIHTILTCTTTAPRFNKHTCRTPK